VGINENSLSTDDVQTSIQSVTAISTAHLSPTINEYIMEVDFFSIELNILLLCINVTDVWTIFGGDIRVLMYNSSYYTIWKPHTIVRSVHVNSKKIVKNKSPPTSAEIFDIFRLLFLEILANADKYWVIIIRKLELS
jgi:hypothetical protein